jgi:hypothetical protein
VFLKSSSLEEIQMPRPSGLRLKPRFTKDGTSNGFTIIGSIAGQRVRARAQSSDPQLAEQEALSLEASLLSQADAINALKTRLTEIEKRLGKIEFLLERFIEGSSK